MNLQTLQINLLNLVKARSNEIATTDVYLQEVAVSPNLELAKKIIHWWRKIQVQNYCMLTGNLLKINGTLDETISQFSKEKFSIFREEVGMEFLDFINGQQTDMLVKSVSQFEQALLRLKMGQSAEVVIYWPYEPFAVIQSLLENTFNECVLQPGNFEIVVSESYGPELFRVYEMVKALDFSG